MDNYYYISPDDYEEAEKNGISRSTLYRRVWEGWSKKDAMTKPVQKRLLNEEHFRIAASNGIGKETLKRRVSRNKWDIEKAITVPPIKNTNKYLDIARENGISATAYRQRVRAGWSKEKASTTPTKTRIECMELARKNKKVS